MNITREIIEDLLPLYLAGEASPATCALVDDYLSHDTELAGLVRAQQTIAIPRPITPLSSDLELRALRRTRRLLGIQKWLFALAITFTATSFTTRITLQDRHVTGIYLMIFDYPLEFGGILVLAIGCWIAYVALRRRLWFR